MDKLSSEKRSSIMRGIRNKDMKPEMQVRRLIFRMGYRYRLHSSHLPGKPDLAFPGLKKVIFVHGCFWHQHKRKNCRDSHIPKTNSNYWEQKLKGNAERDTKNKKELQYMGWKVLIIWECELKNLDRVEEIIRNFLNQV
jgi:DNA mismatch endonuclease (patch repair protein)